MLYASHCSLNGAAAASLGATRHAATSVAASEDQPMVKGGRGRRRGGGGVVRRNAGGKEGLEVAERDEGCCWGGWACRRWWSKRRAREERKEATNTPPPRRRSASTCEPPPTTRAPLLGGQALASALLTSLGQPGLPSAGDSAPPEPSDSLHPAPSSFPSVPPCLSWAGGPLGWWHIKNADADDGTQLRRQCRPPGPIWNTPLTPLKPTTAAVFGSAWARGRGGEVVDEERWPACSRRWSEWQWRARRSLTIWDSTFHATHGERARAEAAPRFRGHRPNANLLLLLLRIAHMLQIMPPPPP